jgi:hypothetical protein
VDCLIAQQRKKDGEERLYCLTLGAALGRNCNNNMGLGV